MKKLLIVCGLALLSTGAFAQLGDFRIGAGVGVGTTGIDIDVSATYGEYLGARFGVDIFPSIKVKTDLDLKTQDKQQAVTNLINKANDVNTQWQATGHTGNLIDLTGLPNRLPDKMDVEGKWTNTTWHLLFDVYPFGARSSFHATVGAYFAPKKIVKVYNKDNGFLSPIVNWNQQVNNLTPAQRQWIDTNAPGADIKMVGAELGDYFITPDPADGGNVEASIEVGGFRPYLGIGFGRAVPKKRIGCQFDLGVQFWGTPKVYAPTYNKTTDSYQREELKKENTTGDAGDALKIISKISVYPVLNFRLVGRIL